jgi:hypothetical protein
VSGADRTRRSRALAGAGVLRLVVKLPKGRLRDVLIEAGLLKEWDDQDKQAIAVAFQRACELWLAREEQRLM